MDIPALLVGVSIGVVITIAGMSWGGLPPDYRPYLRIREPLRHRKPPKVNCEEATTQDAKADTENSEDDWITKENPAVREYLTKEIEDRVLTAVKERREGKKDRRQAIA